MNIFSKLINNINEYIDVRIRSLQLAVVEKVSFVLSRLMYVFVVMGIGLGLLIFFGFGIAEYFSWLVDSRIGGFFLTVAFYLLLLIIVVLLKKSIVRTFTDVFIRALTEKGKEETTDTNKPS